MTPFTLIPGTMPLIVSMPHVATELPSDVAARMTDAGRGVPDTDWHVDRLYDFAAGLGASLIRPLWSRYLIDLNRAPDGRALYPGASNTELCPTTTFDDRPIWQDGEAPTEREIADRREHYWRPYHDALAAELHRVKERHGLALLFDAHSIRSRVPRFFSGQLPDLNLGTGGGVTAAPDLVQRLDGIAKGAYGYTSVLDGRFKGGYIVRAHSHPVENVHAVQLELAQASYMDEDPPFTYRPERADRLKPVLTSLLQAMLEWASA